MHKEEWNVFDLIKPRTMMEDLDVFVKCDFIMFFLVSNMSI